MPRKILIAIVSDERRNDACLSFVTAFLKLQSALFSADVAASVVFSNSEKEMLEQFYRNKDFDAMLYLDSMIGFSPEMALRMMVNDSSSRDMILGVYPLPEIHWDRMEKFVGKKTSASVTEEDLMLSAMTFNIECRGPEDADGYAIVDRVHDMKVYAITRRVVDSFFDPENRSTTVLGWNGPMYCDVARQCSSFGNLDHVGCVGHRSVVR
jgi:hypothetical protein